jgi:hypothetical protein
MALSRIALGMTTLSITTFIVMTLSATKLSETTLSIMTEYCKPFMLVCVVPDVDKLRVVAPKNNFMKLIFM